MPAVLWLVLFLFLRTRPMWMRKVGSALGIYTRLLGWTPKIHETVQENKIEYSLHSRLTKRQRLSFSRKEIEIIKFQKRFVRGTRTNKLLLGLLCDDIACASLKWVCVAGARTIFRFFAFCISTGLKGLFAARSFSENEVNKHSLRSQGKKATTNYHLQVSIRSVSAFILCLINQNWKLWSIW